MSISPLQLVSAAPGCRPLAIRIGDIVFKKAERDDELAQVHALNYSTFVREIGQHADPGGPLLIDKFHDKNLYLVAKRGARVVAMLAVHDRAPFSVASRMPDPAWIERTCRWPLEVRLLTVCPHERQTLVLPGLLWSLYRLALAAGYSHLLASGVRAQLRLYQRLGFSPLGPEQPSGRAFFTPLALEVRRAPPQVRRIARRLERMAGLAPLPARAGTISLQPGPPQWSPLVRRALGSRAISHRDPRFITRYERVRRVLGEMAGTVDAALLAGGGTTANECIAAALAAREPRTPGLILINGEFGERLATMAQRWGLEFRCLRWDWGQGWRLAEVAEALAALPRGSWVWGVHCETSTGVLNPLDRLIALARERESDVCIDCVSSLGSVPLDLRGVMLASAVSGKCLGAVAGLAVLLGDAARLRRRVRRPVPSSLDALAAFDETGPRFTVSSTLLNALAAAVHRYSSPSKRERAYAEYARLGALVRGSVLSLGSRPLSEPPLASPAVTTFAPPMDYSAEHFGLLCRGYGFEINTRSAYLQSRGLVQIATMGHVLAADCRRLFRALKQWKRSAG